jgi:hypothetical protein
MAVGSDHLIPEILAPPSSTTSVASGSALAIVPTPSATTGKETMVESVNLEGGTSTFTVCAIMLLLHLSLTSFLLQAIVPGCTNGANFVFALNDVGTIFSIIATPNPQYRCDIGVKTFKVRMYGGVA